MNISKRLVIRNQKINRIISFGEVTTKEELQEVYRLRYVVYSRKDYIDSKRYLDKMEKDEYDLNSNTHYFIAKLKEGEDNKIIGCIRLIVDDPLPTERYFEFHEPEEIKLIARDQRCELGRLIIVPPNINTGDYLPRGLIMLFLLNVLSLYGMANNLFGGYSFIKESLNKKLKKANFPIGYIRTYKPIYSKDIVLYKYFNQPKDLVLPIFFKTSDFLFHTERLLSNRFLFSRENDKTFTLKKGMIVSILKSLNII